MAVVETSLDSGILTITINNPPRNTIANAVARELFEIERMLYEEKVEVVIFTGAGRLFCAGADVEEMPSIPNREHLDMFSHKLHQWYETIANFPKPTIAAINGTCLGGGLELALTCHFRILSDRGMIGLPEIELGLIPGLGGTQRLPRLIGEARALEMILLGSTISPEQALAYGLVHKVVPRKDVLTEAVALAKRLIGKDRDALRRALRATRAANHVPIQAGLELERTFFGELWDKQFKRRPAAAAGAEATPAPRAPSEE